MSSSLELCETPVIKKMSEQIINEIVKSMEDIKSDEIKEPINTNGIEEDTNVVKIEQIKALNENNNSNCLNDSKKVTNEIIMEILNDCLKSITIN